MRRFLFVFLLAAALVFDLGFYRGWFHLASTGSGDKPTDTIAADEDGTQKGKGSIRERVPDPRLPGDNTIMAPARKGMYSAVWAVSTPGNCR